MKIIFLHGLESTPETSSSVKLIIEEFGSVNVHVPHYFPKETTFLSIIQHLTSLITHYTETMGEDVMLVGISLGGFWALKMTEFTKVKKVILINPAIFKSCERYGTMIDTPSDVMGAMLLNMDDDVVDNEQNFEVYRDKFSVTRFATGGHRATNKEELLPVIRKAVNTLSYWSP